MGSRSSVTSEDGLSIAGLGNEIGVAIFMVVFKQDTYAAVERGPPALSSRSVGREAVHQPGASALLELLDTAAARAVR
jgi:hypothetical protein